MTEEVKKRRGRPKLTPEEKAAAAERRKEQKRAYNQKHKVETVQLRTTVDTASKIIQNATPRLAPPSKEEQAEIDRIGKIMAKAEVAIRAQSAIPKEAAKTVGHREEIYISRTTEPAIQDEPTDPRPSFVRDDDKGWEEL